MDSGVSSLDLFAVARLDFEPPDHERFPCLRLMRAAVSTGGTATAILNAANEVAVAAFLDGRARFLEIAELIDAALNAVPAGKADSLEAVLDADASTRQFVRQRLERKAA
jgi:1-deoxy-D-xylulose-5-phosphate reductoisomerase